MCLSFRRECFMSIKEEKASIRKTIKEKLLKPDSAKIMQDVSSMQEKSEYCASFLSRSSFYKDAKTIFAYLAMQDEFPTLGLLKQIIHDGKTLALPKVDGKHLRFYKVVLKNEQIEPLEKGAYGILEPRENATLLFPNSEDALQSLLPLTIITPARAFSKKGERLGHGGGFYDRFFSELFSTLDRKFISIVGIAFSFQILESLPRGKYDILVDEVITEKKVYNL